MKKFIPFIILMIIAFLVFGVYVVANRLGMPTVYVKEGSTSFWLGLWQGIIVILSFITSWFDKTITIYQVGNSGFWYNLGYLFGISIAFGGGAKASKKR